MLTRRGASRSRRSALLSIAAVVASSTNAALAISDSTTAHFDTNPGWTGRFNNLVPANPPMVTQDFGFSATTIAGGASGELGGTISRTITPAWYAAPIANKTLNDTLTASGKISMPSQSSSAGLHFGWFNSTAQGWRPWNELGFRLDGRGSYANVLLDVMTQKWRAAGVNAGTLPTPLTIPFDGSDHTWQLSYNPSGNGTITFALDNLPPAVLPLPAGLKMDGATFNRFGLLNQQTPSGDMRVYFDDVQYNGVTQNFNNSATGWEQVGNRVTFADPEQRAAQNFGYRSTNHAGGASPGEIGGMVWRSAPHQESYYATPVQGLSLNTPMTATGKVAFRRGASDGGMYFGWFNKASMENSVDVAPQIANVSNFMGVTIEGPSSVGWYFRPVYATSSGERKDSQSGPLIYPDSVSHDFTVSYNPGGNNGGGTMFVTLDGVTKQYNLLTGDRAAGASFDRFGLFSLSPDGHFVEVFFDDLTFTSTFVPQWIGSSGNWNTAGNWSGSLPNGVGTEANLLGTTTGPSTVYTDTAITLGTLRLDSPNTYVIGGAGSLTIQVASGSGLVEVARGVQKINVPVTIASNTTLSVSAGATLKLSDPVTVNAGRSLTHAGSGSVVYESTLTLLGGASALLGQSVRIAALELSPGAKLGLVPRSDAAARLLRVDELTMAPTARLDLADNAAVLGKSDMSVETVRQHLLAGTVMSSLADQSRRIGYADNELLGLVQFAGEAVEDDAILLQFTYAGDVNLDQQVDIADLAALAGSWQTTATWTGGDFDYDGFVDIADLTLLAMNWQAGRAAAVPLEMALAAFGLPLVAVPEPLGAGVFVACASGCVIRPRHSRRR